MRSRADAHARESARTRMRTGGAYAAIPRILRDDAVAPAVAPAVACADALANAAMTPCASGVRILFFLLWLMSVVLGGIELARRLVQRSANGD